MTGPVYSALKDRRMELGPFVNTTQLLHRSAIHKRWNHWDLARDAGDVAWLLLDKAGASANVLSEEVLRELGEVIESLQDEMPRALVIRSAKPGSFCVGADISEFRQLHNERDVINKLSDAHILIQQLADLPCPTIAVIHGAALGGGLELALCCDYRLAIPGASFGLPEILLGLHPGLGGTARLPALIPPLDAMQMMLTGKNTYDRKALSLGLIDRLVEERHLQGALDDAINGKLPQRRSDWRAQPFLYGWVRRLVGRRMRAEAAKQAPPQHYPAPEALISLWEKHAGNPGNMLHAELLSFSKLLNTQASRNLVRVFFMREKLKEQGKSKSLSSDAIKHLHVIGAGSMGGDIAGWAALQGLRVSLHDTQPGSIAKAIGNAAKLCQAKHLSSSETRDVLDRLIPDPDNSGVEQADLVLEAVPEDLELKLKIHSAVEPRLKAGAILATNTSSIMLEDLRGELSDPTRLVGIHFFNPVAKMQLVEVVHHSVINATIFRRARQFVDQIGKLPVPVASAPGFLVNRALTPYLVEAICLLDEGVPAEAIDQVAINFGMPMGPIELADQVGLDVCLGVADMLRERVNPHQPEAPQWLRTKVEKGHLGRKSGKGLYTWKDGKPKKRSPRKPAPTDTLDRLILPMLNACMACLREEVVADADLLDGAMIFATGFAPFTGGPMHYAAQRGVGEVVKRLRDLEEDHGERFSPDPGWSQGLLDPPAAE